MLTDYFRSVLRQIPFFGEGGRREQPVKKFGLVTWSAFFFLLTVRVDEGQWRRDGIDKPEASIKGCLCVAKQTLGTGQTRQKTQKQGKDQKEEKKKHLSRGLACAFWLINELLFCLSKNKFACYSPRLCSPTCAIRACLNTDAINQPKAAPNDGRPCFFLIYFFTPLMNNSFGLIYDGNLVIFPLS